MVQFQSFRRILLTDSKGVLHVNPVFRFVLAFVGLALTARPACPTVLFLNHFDQALDGDHSYYGQPKATVEGLTLTADGAGHPFEGTDKRRALDAGYTDAGNRNAVVRFDASNLQSQRGTVEFWVILVTDENPSFPLTLRGDRLTFHSEYKQLPEYAAIRSAWIPSPLSRRLAAVMGVNVQQSIVGVTPRTGDGHKSLCYRVTRAFLQFWPNAPASRQDMLFGSFGLNGLLGVAPDHIV